MNGVGTTERKKEYAVCPFISKLIGHAVVRSFKFYGDGHHQAGTYNDKRVVMLPGCLPYLALILDFRKISKKRRHETCGY